MRFGAALVTLTTMLAVVSSGNIPADQTVPGYVILNLGKPSNPGGCSRLGSGGACDIYFGSNSNTASPSASPLPTSNFNLWVYAGNSGYSSDYMVRIHGFSVSMSSFIISNSSSQNPYNARVTVSVDKSFTAGSIIVGPYGYLWADAGVTQQNAIVMTTNYFTMLANSVVDSANIFNVIVNAQTTFTAIGSNAPWFRVAKAVFYGNVSLYAAQVFSTIGIEFSATTVVDGCSKINSPLIWIKQPYNLPLRLDTLHCTSTCNELYANGGSVYFSSPIIVSNCNTTANILNIIPPINFAASFGNSTTGSSNSTGGTKHKRDGTTQQSTYNSGSATANSVVLTASYIGGPLFRRREAALSKKRTIVAQSNFYQVINGHVATLTQMTRQDSSSMFWVSCDSSMRWVGGNTSVIARECGAGCPQNTTCPNGGNIYSVPSSNKREVDEE